MEFEEAEHYYQRQAAYLGKEFRSKMRDSTVQKTLQAHVPNLLAVYAYDSRALGIGNREKQLDAARPCCCAMQISPRIEHGAT